jgi:hypothetical protein
MQRKSASPLLNTSATAGPSQQPQPAPLAGKSAAVNGLYGVPVQARPNNIPPNKRPTHPPPADPRAQWEIDAETARLRAQADAERRAAEHRRKERQKADDAEAKRIKKMLDAEEKEQRRRQAEIDRETERLRKQYGDQSGLMPPPKPSLPERHSAPTPGSSGFFPNMNPSGWFGGPQHPQQPVRISPLPMVKACSTAFSNSRTLPGHR